MSEDVVGAYLVERYWPGVTEASLRAALRRLPPSPPGLIRHLGSLFIPTDEVVFCVFQAVSVAAVEEANRRGGAPFERVVETMVIPAQPQGATSAGFGGP